MKAIKGTIYSEGQNKFKEYLACQNTDVIVN